MSDDFNAFMTTAKVVVPRVAVVLGSGLGDVAQTFVTSATLSYARIPGFVPSSVIGHKGQLAVGQWGQTPAMICYGRVHFYEGHPWERVTRLIGLAHELGVSKLILTNAAGGIHDDLNPGDLMAIRAHMKLLDPLAWKAWVSDPEKHTSHRIQSGRYQYSPRLMNRLQHHDAKLPTGTYAALTGPCYETPAEIRALKTLGADAVGMSTAMEAEAAVSLGMEVAGISCITNKAAGLGSGTLNHHEVEQTAKLAVKRLGQLLGKIIGEL